jgi:hypothetical protein
MEGRNDKKAFFYHAEHIISIDFTSIKYLFHLQRSKSACSKTIVEIIWIEKRVKEGRGAGG